MTQVWQECQTGQYPNDMVTAGKDIDGSEIFVGRAFFQDDLVPAKVIPKRNEAFVCYDGGEHFVDKFEVLICSSYVWKSGAYGSVPVGAISAGHTIYGEPLFIGRAQYRGSLTPGKVQITHCCLYIPFNGGEIKINEYEVLCAD